MLLRTKPIAVVGVSDMPGRASNLMMYNLLDENFNGNESFNWSALPMTPKYPAVCGALSYPAMASLPLMLDLAVLLGFLAHGSKTARYCYI